MNDEERLRDALVQEEPDPLDPNSIIASARAKQARQRQVIAGSMAGVAAVVVIGGFSVLSLGGSPNTSSAPDAAAPASTTGGAHTDRAGSPQADAAEASPGNPKPQATSAAQPARGSLTDRPRAVAANLSVYVKDGQWCRVAEPSDVCQPFTEGTVPVDATTTVVVGRVPQTAGRASATVTGTVRPPESKPATLWRTPNSDWTIIAVTHQDGDVVKVAATDTRGDEVWRSS